ncbi:hypothetical protein Aperf_G00000071015 [Anoplocephala perfoliata]
MVIRRAFLANVLTLRESAGFIVKRIGDLYRVGCFNVSQDLTVNRGQKVLLCAFLISFAQDSISEDEMITTVEAFDVEKCNGICSFNSQNACSEIENEELVCEGDLQSARVYSSLESPLTFCIRDLRHFLRLQRQELFANIFRSRPPEVSSPASEKVVSSFSPASSSHGVMLTTLSNRLEADGGGFINAEWELIIDRPDLRMWRRPSKRSGISNAVYDYRVCGSFKDISALCFLEVQLNLEYRRQWDDSIVALESSRSMKEVSDAAETEVIRWVSRFPFPMARREYVYARRWWLTTPVPTSTTKEGGIALIISRVCNCKSKDSSPDDSTNNPSHNAVEAQSDGGMVTVRAYESNMLIRSHGNIDEPGMDYFLIYSDDPQLILSAEAVGRISSIAIPKLLDKLHDAALTIAKEGLPEFISPIVLPSASCSQTNAIPVASSSECSDEDAGSSSPDSSVASTPSFINRLYRRLFGS